jgi:hypothetical protein
LAKKRDEKPWRAWDRWKVIESHVTIRLVLRQFAYIELQLITLDVEAVELMECDKQFKKWLSKYKKKR